LIYTFNLALFGQYSANNAKAAVSIFIFKSCIEKYNKQHSVLFLFQAIIEDIKMSQDSSSGSGMHDTPSPSLLNNLRQFRFQKKSTLKIETNRSNGITNNGTPSK
jgi:hypothetical protein